MTLAYYGKSNGRRALLLLAALLAVALGVLGGATLRNSDGAGAAASPDPFAATGVESGATCTVTGSPPGPATCSEGQSATYLFTAALPAGASVDGVEVTFTATASASGNNKADVFLVKGSTDGDKKTVNNISNSSITYASVGDTNDDWSLNFDDTNIAQLKVRLTADVTNPAGTKTMTFSDVKVIVTYSSSSSSSSGGPVTGAVNTTTSTGTVQNGNNQYTNKCDVYLRSAQQGQSNLGPDGLWYIRVTGPNDSPVLTPSPGYFTAVVQDGKFVSYGGNAGTANTATNNVVPLCAIGVYADTPNPGGVYQATASYGDTTFASNNSKSDNFKVDEPEVTVVKVAAPGSPSETTTFAGTLDPAGPAAAVHWSVSGIGQQQTGITLPSGSVTVAETTKGAGWSFVGAYATDAVAKCSTSKTAYAATVTVGGNNDVICVMNEKAATPAAPDLKITKTNDAPADLGLNEEFTWTLVIENVGAFVQLQNGNVIFTDNFPANFTLTFPNFDAWTEGGIWFGQNSGLGCNVGYGAGPTVSCSAIGQFNWPQGGKVIVTLKGTITSGSSATNPAAGGVCAADPGGVVTEADETNNSCSDTVNVRLPNLKVTKTNDTSGAADGGETWKWRLAVTNAGNVATFTSGQVILSDALPSGAANGNPVYGTPSVQNASGVTNAGNINCSITSGVLTCTASGASVGLNSTASFDVSFTVTTDKAFGGSLANPATRGGCAVDPNNVVAESDESDNSCGDTVVISADTGKVKVHKYIWDAEKGKWKPNTSQGQGGLDFEFYLDDISTGTFEDIAQGGETVATTGQHTIYEVTPPSGYTFFGFFGGDDNGAKCLSTEQGAPANPSDIGAVQGQGASVTVKKGATTNICAYNVPTVALTVYKVAQTPATLGSATFSGTLDPALGANVAWSGNTGSAPNGNSTYSVSAGSLTLAEDATAGWTFVGYKRAKSPEDCNNTTDGYGKSAVEVGGEWDVICVLNSQDTIAVTVFKVANSPATLGSATFSGQLDPAAGANVDWSGNTGSDPDGNSTYSILPGLTTLTESSTTGWALVGYKRAQSTTECGQEGYGTTAVELTATYRVICVLNERTSNDVTVRKVVTNVTDDPATFSVQQGLTTKPVGETSPQVFTVSPAVQNASFVETVPQGYAPLGYALLTSTTQTCPAQPTTQDTTGDIEATVDALTVEDPVLCLYNLKLGAVQVVKTSNVEGGNTSWTFQSSAPGVGGSLQTAGSSNANPVTAQTDVVYVAPGSYTVAELQGQLQARACVGGSTPADFFTTAEVFQGGVSQGAAMEVGASNVSFSVQAGVTTTVQFRNVSCGTVLAAPNIFVRKFSDPAGTFSGTAGLAGWQITLTRDGGGYSSTLTTDANGLAGFAGIPAGTYTVAETAQAGWGVVGSKLDGANPQAGTSRGSITVGLAQSATVSFYNQPQATIRVHKTIIDGRAPAANGPGWTFTLGGCGLAASAKVTDANGNAEWTGVPVPVNCSYTVTETVQGTWTVAPSASQPAAPNRAGQVVTLEFVNVRDLQVCTNCVQTPTTPTPGPSPSPSPSPSPTPSRSPSPSPTPSRSPSPSPSPSPTGTAPATPTEAGGGIVGPSTPVVDLTAGASTTPRAPSAGSGSTGGGGLLNTWLAGAGALAVAAGLGLLALKERDRR